jgi:pyridoxal phosphate enzyme (YggS family)
VSIIAANLEHLRQRIEIAAHKAGRDPDQIIVVAVTKTHPVETVCEAYKAGFRHFGENRTAEGNRKISDFDEWRQQQSSAEPAEWHFIGHIQSRQAGDVLSGGYRLLHSIDSLKLAGRLSRLIQRDKLPPVSILLQCNVSGESSKSGFITDRWEQNSGQLRQFIDSVLELKELPGLKIQGLMTMAPIVDDPEETRPFFSTLFRLSEHLRQEITAIEWDHLSMGMTDDFDVAIEEGATIVRIGRAIFGERQHN